MKLTELIEHLTAHDVRLSADGDLLRYDGPAHVMDEALLRELRRHKSGLLRWLARPVDAPPADTLLPASQVQRRIWDAHHASTDPGSYNVTCRVPLAGRLDPEALRDAYTDLVARHAILRTRLHLDGDTLMQRIDPPTPRTIPLIDLSTLSDASREAEVARWCRQEAGRPFDITAEHPIRLLLARLGPADWVLLVVQHHFVTDAWSLAVLFEELSELYTARVEGRPTTLAEAPQYARFQAWEAGYLTPSRITEAVEFWRRELDGAQLRVNLRYDRGPSPEPSWRGGLCVFPIEPALAEAVARCARECGTTPYPVLASAFALVMSEFTGETDLLLSGTIANRVRQEFEGMLGVFTNSVILRTRIERAGTFADLVRQTGRMFFRGLDHQSVPFWTVAKALSLPTGPGTVFGQVKFTVNNTPPAVVRLPGLVGRVYDAQPEGSKCDFGVLVVSEEDGQSVHMEYRVERFDHATIESFGQRYLRLLRLVTADPDLSPGEAIRRSSDAG